MENSPRTLPHLIADGAARGGSLTMLGRDPAIADTRGYAELYEAAGPIAAGLLALGLEPGARVGIVGETSFDFVTMSIAAWRAGMVVVLLPERLHRSVSDWASSVATRVAFAEAEAILVAGGKTVDEDLGARLIDVSKLGRGDPVTIDADLDDVAAIFFTSGTTASPKAIPMTHRNFAHQFRLRRGATSASGPQHHIFWWSPLHASMGFQRAMLDPLTQGISVTHLSPRHLMAAPHRWLIEISRRRITHSGGPTFGFDLATRAVERGLPEQVDLSCWEECGALGELVKPAVLERFFDVTKPLGLDRDSFVGTYATTETSVVTARSLRGLWIDRVDPTGLGEGVAHPSTDPRAASFVSTGPPLEGVDLTILDARGEELPERQIGDIFVRSPGTMSNYLGSDERVEWFRTRDRGYLADGELFVVGRFEDVIIVRGANIAINGIEECASSALPPGCTPCAFGVTAGSSDEVVLVIGTSRDVEVAPEEIESRARRVLWERMALSVHDIVQVTEDELPRAAGKLERAELRRRYLVDRLGRSDA